MCDPVFLESKKVGSSSLTEPIVKSTLGSSKITGLNLSSRRDFHGFTSTLFSLERRGKNIAHSSRTFLGEDPLF